MKLKKLIGSAALILGLQDVVSLVEDDKSGEEQLHENANYRMLHSATNLVLANVTSNYIDCIATQTFTVKDNKVDFDKFDNTFLKVRKVCAGGAEVDYALYTGFIKVPNGRVEVEYAFVPSFNVAEDEVSLNGLSEQGMVYGILAEYAFISGMFNEAKIWNEKFEQFLFGSKTGYKQVTIPAPKW